MIRLVVFIIVIFFITPATQTFARSGCCSHHGGVMANGCGCNDGSSLSAKCAPYYACTAGSTTTRVAVPTTAPRVYTPIPKQTVAIKK